MENVIVCVSYEYRISESAISTIAIVIAALGVTGAFAACFASSGPQILFGVW